jgi:hypothetical protein
MSLCIGRRWQRICSIIRVRTGEEEVSILHYFICSLGLAHIPSKRKLENDLKFLFKRTRKNKVNQSNLPIRLEDGNDI